MSKTYKIRRNDKCVKGGIELSGSKSISNRVLVIRALCAHNFQIDNLSRSKDTTTMVSLLSSDAEVLDAGHAGTTFRFMTAVLSLGDKVRTLTGSSRMKERPIGPLVEALRTLGAQIDYIENQGYPPLRIHPFQNQEVKNVRVPGDISSQFISALLLIAPKLPNGLNITIEGELVSRPYVQMTLDLMHTFGISYLWADDTISIEPQDYIPSDYEVEGDWSSASYFYSIAALSDSCDLYVKNLKKDSLQGDARIAEISQKWGIDTRYTTDGIHIEKNKISPPSTIEYNFVEVPDIAQSVAVMCGGTEAIGVFSGLQTLKIKETDRIQALKNELAKFQVFFSKLPAKFSKKSSDEYYMVQGTIVENDEAIVATYQDHRMAMAFAPLALLFPIQVSDVDVVKKSYVDFWQDLQSLGFIIEEVSG